MTITTTAGGSALRRVRALSQAEFVLLRRNKLLLFNAAVVPLLPVALLVTVRTRSSLDPDLAITTLLSTVSLVLLIVVYYNLLSAYVARREELVLKRLRTGECTDGEILTGTAVPAITIAIGMTLLTTLVGTIALGLPAPANPVLLAAGVLGGMLVFTALALVTSTATRNSEAAQITSMPVLLISVLGMPQIAANLPAPVDDLAVVTPLYPVLDLATLGWQGQTVDGEAVGFVDGFAHAWQPSLVIVGWLVLGAVIARAYFRWEPRS